MSNLTSNSAFHKEVANFTVDNIHGILLKCGALKIQKSGKLVTKHYMKCVEDHMQGIPEFGFTTEFVMCIRCL